RPSAFLQFRRSSHEIPEAPFLCREASRSCALQRVDGVLSKPPSYRTAPVLREILMTVSASVLSEDRLRDFKSRFRGDLLRPGTDAYESARKVWNGMIDRRPAWIARCRGVEDVQLAVRFARE